jgi:hypothetical protein
MVSTCHLVKTVDEKWMIMNLMNDTIATQSCFTEIISANEGIHQRTTLETSR